MSDTRTLLEKIGALRQRLDLAQGLVNEARSAAAALTDNDPVPLDAVVERAGEIGIDLDLALASLAPDTPRTPAALTHRARHLLERGRVLLARLRELADSLDGDAGLFADTVAMIDTAVRTVALLPDSPGAQLRFCRGLEVTLAEVDDRLRALLSAEEQRRRHHEDVHQLSGVLSALHDGESFDYRVLHALTERVLAEVDECRPLTFLHELPDSMPAFAAAHGLTTARVLARLIRCDPELRAHAVEAVTVALVHDVGMLSVPSEAISAPGELETEQRRLVEAHTVAGARAVATLFRESPALIEAVAGHHERLDGTGYPDGVKGDAIRPLTRLLAVSDVYAAMCQSRPHRPARSTRTALADTLLLVEQGQLDRVCAGHLLRLSFYPVGTAVELASGAVGVVVATPSSMERADPARPVVAVLTDEAGEPLPRPHHLDLGQTEAHSIARALSGTERLEVLGRRLARWAA